MRAILLLAILPGLDPTMWELTITEPVIALQSYQQGKNPVVSFTCSSDGAAVGYGPLDAKPAPNTSFSMSCDGSDYPLYPKNVGYHEGYLILNADPKHLFGPMLKSHVCSMNVGQISKSIPLEGFQKRLTGFIDACVARKWDF